MKLEFFRRSVELVEQYRRPGQAVQHTFQTNGSRLVRPASCTAGRAAFITGQSPIRTGLTKVGLPGSKLGPSRRIRGTGKRGLSEEPRLQEEVRAPGRTAFLCPFA
jgi:hypothetical protein